MARASARSPGCTRSFPRFYPGARAVSCTYVHFPPKATEPVVMMLTIYKASICLLARRIMSQKYSAAGVSGSAVLLTTQIAGAGKCSFTSMI
jgi:hypothetical protein